MAKKKKETLPAVIGDLEKYTGEGFEGADKDAYAIPFLRILQSNSPQVNEDLPSYVKGAKPGMFFNTVTNVIYGRKIEVIPIHYGRDFIEWQPNRGGFVKAHGPDPRILDRVTNYSDKNEPLLDTGNVIQDSRNHFCLIAGRLSEGPIILSLVSTGLKHSRKWMTIMNTLQLPGSSKPAPMFAGVWKISTVVNENDDGTWYQIGDKNSTKITFERFIDQGELDAALVARGLVTSGDVKADWDSTRESSGSGQRSSSEEGGPPSGDDLPF